MLRSACEGLLFSYHELVIGPRVGVQSLDPCVKGRPYALRGEEEVDPQQP